MKRLITIVSLALLAMSQLLQAQSSDASTAPASYKNAQDQVVQQLKASLEQLSALREQQKFEILPLSRRLSDLESELLRAREEYQTTSRQVASRTLDLTNMRVEIKTRIDESTYLSNLLSDYLRNFESRLHITEVERYRGPIEAAKLAPESAELSDSDIFKVQVALLGVSLDRALEALGGARFRGTVVDDRSLLRMGTVALVGPVALFVADDRKLIGMAEAHLGSLEPASVPFARAEDSEAAAKLVINSSGYFPLDPTLGNAQLVEATKESLLEHVKKGGAVMIPIFGMAALALLVALYKWLALLFTPSPSAKKVSGLLTAIGESNQQEIHDQARRIRGPVGQMLVAGVENLREPQALLEEVMYEIVLTAKLKLQRMLPFLQICAASAPLLGLLGTVTGIINTFKLITIFGSGDVKSLSGGISEALITTKFGLIVAIPSLLLHAFLSRKAKGITDSMEKTAISFINAVMRSRTAHKHPEAIAFSDPERPATAPDKELVREQVNAILKGMLCPSDADSAEPESHPGAQGY